VALTGATPVFADISLDDFCLDPESVEAAITSKTAGIMPVHLYGHPAPMRELRTIADKYRIAIFEDAAQAHMAEIDGQRVGTFGQFAMFSMYPTKNMTSGEGGMVVCEDEDFARRVRLLRNQGMETQYNNEIVGLNNRMTDIHAAIGRVQLRRLPAWTLSRISNASTLSELITGVTTPRVSDTATHVFHQYTIRISENRDEVAERLKTEFGVGTGIYYPIPIHQLTSLNKFPAVDDLPNTLLASKTVLSLPVHPGLSTSELKRIARAVNKSVTRPHG
jgi:dTDP-4-amino-4,6-dideoxygalactose transaminase